MLILMRRPGQRIKIGPHIVVRVLNIGGGQVELGIDAPDDLPIICVERSGRSQAPRVHTRPRRKEDE